MLSNKTYRKLFASRAVQEVIQECREQSQRLNVCGVKVNIENDLAHGLGRRSSHLIRRASKDIRCSERALLTASAARRNTITTNSISGSGKQVHEANINLPQSVASEDELTGWPLAEDEDTILEHPRTGPLRSMVQSSITKLRDCSDAPSLKLEKYRDFMKNMSSAGTLTKDDIGKLALRCVLLQQKVVTLEDTVKSLREVKEVKKRRSAKHNTITEGLENMHRKIPFVPVPQYSTKENSPVVHHADSSIQQRQQFVRLQEELSRCCAQLEDYQLQIIDLTLQSERKDQEIASLQKEVSRSQCCQQAQQERNKQLEQDTNQLRQRLAEMEYQVTCRKELQTKLCQRNKLISELQLQLVRMNKENSMQRSKLDSFYNSFYSKIIKEKYLIEGIDGMYREATVAHDKLMRITQEIERDTPDPTLKEKATFLKHLSVRSHQLMNGVAAELRVQLQALDSQRNGYCSSLQQLKSENSRLLLHREQCRTLYSSCQQRFEKYLQEMHRINVKSCITCNEFLGYSYQINRILDQLTTTIFH